MDGWLQNVTLSTDIRIGALVAATLTALSIAWLVVGYETFKSTISDRVEAQRRQ